MLLHTFRGNLPKCINNRYLYRITHTELENMKASLVILGALAFLQVAVTKEEWEHKLCVISQIDYVGITITQFPDEVNECINTSENLSEKVKAEINSLIAAMDQFLEDIKGMADTFDTDEFIAAINERIPVINGTQAIVNKLVCNKKDRKCFNERLDKLKLPFVAISEC